MNLIARFALSLDGFSADANGYPAILAAPGFDHGKSSHGIPEFAAECDAIAMGRVTFDPAVDNAWWPWPDLDVHVLTSRPLPEQDFPSEVTAHADPVAMVAALGERYDGNVHLLGGPTTIAKVIDLDVVDRLDVLIVPALFGEGTPLAQDPRARYELTLEAHEVFPDGAVQLSYSFA
jgi:dihydrofolate reductase